MNNVCYSLNIIWVIKLKIKRARAHRTHKTRCDIRVLVFGVHYRKILKGVTM